MKIKNAKYVNKALGIIDMTVVDDDGSLGFGVGVEIPFTYAPDDEHGLSPKVRSVIHKVKVRE